MPDIVVGPADPDADQVDGLVQLPTGSGALVAARPSPGTPGTTVYLVTDTGVRYPVAGQKALEQLGLSGLSVAQLPERWWTCCRRARCSIRLRPHCLPRELPEWPVAALARAMCGARLADELDV